MAQHASALLRNTGLNLIGLVIPFLVMVGTVPPTVRLMGEDRYGFLSLVVTFCNVLTMLDLGLGRATTRFVAHSLGGGAPARVRPIIRYSLALSMGLGLLATALYVAAVGHIAQALLVSTKIPPAERVWLLMLCAPVIITTFIRGTLGGALEGMARFDLVNLLRIPFLMANSALPLVVLCLGGGLQAIIVVLIAKDVLLLSVAYRLVRGLVPQVEEAVAPGEMRPLFVYAGWLWIHNMASCVLNFTERFLVASQLSMVAMTFFAIPAELTSKLMVLPGAAMMVLFPAFSSLSAAGGEDRDRLFWSALKVLSLAMGLVALVLILFAEPLVTLWLTAKFAPTILILEHLAAGIFLATISWLLSSYLSAAGHIRTVTFIVVPTAFCHVFATWYLVHEWNLLGAAIASNLHRVVCIGLFGRAVFYHGLVKRLPDLSGLFRPVLAVGILAAVVRFPQLPGPMVLAKLVVPAVVLVTGYALIAWGLALSVGEKEAIWGALLRFRGSPVARKAA